MNESATCLDPSQLQPTNTSIQTQRIRFKFIESQTCPVEEVVSFWQAAQLATTSMTTSSSLELRFVRALASIAFGLGILASSSF